LDGFCVPGGTIVAINPWVVARDESVVGPDPDCFKPERWLTASPQDCTAMRYAAFTFDAGAHSCIGEKLVKTQIAKLVLHVFSLFKFHFANVNQRRETEGGLLVRQKGYSVIVERR
jgi:cytochrome P450